MTLWLAIGGLSLAAILPILWPLLRPGKVAVDRLDHDLEVYRDQMREVDAELAANTVTEREAGEARREIERRILRAAEHGQSAHGPAAPSAMTAVLIALFLPSLTLLLYSQIGQPTQPDQPLASRDVAPPPPQPSPRALTDDQNEQIKQMVARLAQRLKEEPNDLDGWTLLGRSQAALGQFDEAAKALRKAIALSDGDADLLVAFGDILTKEADGIITPEALIAFSKARELAPNSPAARYFIALADLQGGRPQQAYDAWLGLYRELPPNSDNRQALAEQIRRVAQQLDVDPEEQLAEAVPADRIQSSAPPSQTSSPTAPGPDRAAMAEAAKLSTPERQEFIQSMVQRLADRLRDEPDDFDGWMRLGRAYGVLRKHSVSADAYGHAAALRPNDPVPLNAQVVALIEAAPSDQAMPETTLAVLRRLEKLQPDNSRALWFLGMADASAGRRDEAIVRWQRLYDQMPKDSREREGLKAAIDRLAAAK
ncbi:MAG: c-type cytochrome biogenesis protein CcmI [Rhodospirillaceae bacterium]|jgi:cytochrome c-type biogenesis protein CcmH|nr:c-type cytochrome biogenesis protein CcmI [Rhodospirillaceae bacterium]MBT4489745.1 c-type cytochrome biogenesis protein CcmI [Rhodospirillaceae bacterium]MBT4687023.1 c-type cytochrome biogenesis protein CcmI [Rhodospirillaceae bacterium]MBT6430378.1 c-type cytochrome biogenesis protein CcmI [Rhodospirillaceae bacterium]